MNPSQRLMTGGEDRKGGRALPPKVVRQKIVTRRKAGQCVQSVLSRRKKNVQMHPQIPRSAETARDDRVQVATPDAWKKPNKPRKTQGGTGSAAEEGKKQRACFREAEGKSGSRSPCRKEEGCRDELIIVAGCNN